MVNENPDGPTRNRAEPRRRNAADAVGILCRGRRSREEHERRHAVAGAARDDRVVAERAANNRQPRRSAAAGDVSGSVTAQPGAYYAVGGGIALGGMVLKYAYAIRSGLASAEPGTEQYT